MNRKMQRIMRIGSMQRRGERGQAFSEMALSLLFLLTLMSVVVDLGWAFYTMISLRDAAQEAASYGSMCPLESDDVTANVELIRERLVLSAEAPIDMGDIDPNDIDIWFTDVYGTVTDPPVMGGSIIVKATIQHKIVTPFVGAFIGKQEYPLTVQIADTVMRSKWMRPCK